MGLKLLKVFGKAALEVTAAICVIADGILLRDILWIKADEHAKKKAAKKAEKEAKAKAAQEAA